MANTKTTIGNQASAALAPKLTELEQAALTPEQREEELLDREAALAAREARLQAMEARVMSTMERLERAVAGKPLPPDEESPKVEYDESGREIPRLDLSLPHGVVIGDPDSGYVQNGHRFSKDRRYMCEEPKGVGKPFNIQLLGLVKVVSPRQTA